MKVLMLILILLSPNAIASIRSFDDVIHDMDDKKALVCTGADGDTTYTVSLVNADQTNVAVVEIDKNVFGMDYEFIKKFNVYILRTHSIIDYDFNTNLKIQIGKLQEYGYLINIKTNYNQTIVEIANEDKHSEISISNFDDFIDCFKFVQYAMKNI